METKQKGAIVMTITLDFQPDIEQGLLAQAQARGVSIADYVKEIVAREVHIPEAPIEGVSAPEARNLVELFANSPFKGMNMEFERDRDYGREIEL